MGSHSEKDYLTKTAQFLDGVIVGANLVEATPAATASLLVRLAGKKTGKKTPPDYYIDPMTYAYGVYTDRDTGKVRGDLDWIKSDQKRDGTEVRDFKRSYRSLAEQFGSVFAGALHRGRALTTADFTDSSVIRSACEAVAEYQEKRLQRVFEEDAEYAECADAIPAPSAVLAPYVYIEPSRCDALTELNLRLASGTAHLGLKCPVHAVICADASLLQERPILERLKQQVPATGVAGVWLWFSKFFEDRAEPEQLLALRSLVEDLSRSIEVYNMHGGYLRLAFAKYGLSGISHGVGYGEQKDVVPVIGQSTPTVRYYLPAVHKRFGVLEIERSFESLKITTPSDFHERICDCVVCRGVVSRDASDFSGFGERRYSTPQSQRQAQTPAAAKRCRFHFLMRRIAERNWIRTAEVRDIRDQLYLSASTWSAQLPLGRQCAHLHRWRQALESA